MADVDAILPAGTARPDYRRPLPSWVEELRESQVDAVREAVEHFNDGARVVFVDAPVGAGKTLIGELVRRELDVSHGLYICSDKQLQDQFLRDFPYAKVLKGRANYRPTRAIGDISCDDCTAMKPGDSCNWCPSVPQCPYRVAREQALGHMERDGDGEQATRRWAGGAPVAVLNTAYFLAAGNFTRTLRKYRLVVADECDMLEGALTGFIEFHVPEWIAERLQLDMPKKAVRKPTLIAWLKDASTAAALYLSEFGEGMKPKQQRSMESFVDEAMTMAGHLQADVENASRDEDDDSDEDGAGRWIRDYETSTLLLRPVTVDRYGPKNLWRHGQRWLLMSGTVISADEMADSLGLEDEYRSVVVPSSFPVENRPIVLAPVANVTRTGGELEWEKLVVAIDAIIRGHPGRILVHTVSYVLTKYLWEKVDAAGRRKVKYDNGRMKQQALRDYLATPGAVMFAPSMDRGVDLKGDKCEVQVIAKCPFPSLGDKQVSARMHMPGGQQWYAVQTIRDIVQMTGRGVRSETDTCVTYVLDAQFTRNVWGKNKQLFPRYFRDAVRERDDVRWLLGGKRRAA